MKTFRLLSSPSTVFAFDTKEIIKIYATKELKHFLNSAVLMPARCLKFFHDFIHKRAFILLVFDMKQSESLRAENKG
jgi:hypothetical protein